MILQALKEYYDRKAADPKSGIAPPGFEWKEIPYIIVLDEQGKPINIETTYEGEGKKRRAKRFLVPKPVKRTVGIASNILWDNPAYALGIWVKDPKKESKKSDQEQQQRVQEQHEAFTETATKVLKNSQNVASQALLKFLAVSDKKERLNHRPEVLEALLVEGGNLTFRLANSEKLILEEPEIKKALVEDVVIPASGKTLCLVSGKQDTVKRLHDSIKGVLGAQTSGANIVSFNLSSFTSYGKDQGYNAPIGESAAFAYAEALNTMLRRDSGNRMLVGDATTVFWAAKKEDQEFEKAFAAFFNEPSKDNPDEQIEAVKGLIKAIETGAYNKANETGRMFYVLGLSPNASRISIRFWHHSPISEIAPRIADHFQDIQICHGPKEPDYLSLFRLLVSTAALGKSENIPPNLAGDTIRSILGGLPYPRTLLQTAVRRNRAEQSVTYARASLIKACLNRTSRNDKSHNKEELHVSLDLENTNTGYRLGRLFATLEKIQIESRNQKKPSASDSNSSPTIRDRYYGAASGTPVAVFSTLMKLKNHHLSKIDKPGSRIYFEQLIGEILNVVTDFPAHLDLSDQGQFAIGYYHQNRDFYTKKQTPDTEEKGE